MGSACTSSKPSVGSLDEIDAQPSYHSSMKAKGKSSIFSFTSASESEESQSGMHSDHQPSPNDLSQASVTYPGNDPATDDRSPTPAPARPRATPVDPKSTALADFPKDFRKMMCGRMDWKLELESKMIYLVHCANFSDSQQERGALHREVYPRLREYCAEHGCELVVVDPLWGLRDPNAYQHSVVPVTLQLIKELAARDASCILTIFLNDKYGTYWCPLSIGVDVFCDVLKKVTEDDKHFLLRLYALDGASQPPLYRLQPVEAHISRYATSSALDGYLDGCREWKKQLIRLRSVISQASSSEFQKDTLKSDLESQIEQAVLSKLWSSERVIWLQRTLTGINELTSDKLSHYLDLVSDRYNEGAQNRLKNLCNQLDRSIDPSNKIHTEVKWHDGGLDPAGVKEHAQYLQTVCTDYEDLLRRHLDQIIAQKQKLDRKKIKLVHRGLSKELYTDLIQNTHVCQSLCSDYADRNEIMDKLEHYIDKGHIDLDSEVKAAQTHPLVLHGVTGSGKSTLSSVLGRNACSIPGWTSSVCVIRYIGMCIECETLDQLQRSIMGQIRLLAPTSITTNKQLQNDKCLDSLIQKIPSATPLLIIIDDLEKVKVHGDSRHLTWLPTRLPEHVRMVVSVTSASSWYAALQKHLLEESVFVEVPLLTADEAVVMVTDGLQCRQRQLSVELRENIEETYIEGSTPLLMKVMTCLLLDIDLDLEDDATSDLFEKDLAGLVSCLLGRLEKRFGQDCIARVLSYITSSRYGVSDAEMIDLLSCDPVAMATAFPYDKFAAERFPSFPWTAAKSFLEPFLVSRICEGTLVSALRHDVFNSVIRSRYAHHLNPVEHGLLEYFSDKRHGKTMTYKRSTGEDATITCSVRTHRTTYKHCLNRRKLDELPYQLARRKGSAATTNYIDKCLLNWAWLKVKLKCCGVHQVLQDIKLVSKAESQRVKYLQQVLVSLAPILVQDPDQLPQQLFVRSDLNKLDTGQIAEIAKASTKTVGPILTPSDPEAFASTFEKNARDAEPVITSLSRFRDDLTHLISVAPSSGELKVWNISRCEIVRTLTGLNEPKAVQLCSAYKAIVLCNRELKIYNLDEGTSLATLKGVLNIRMPYFGVHDEHHTIAMARNRMCFNMMNNTTGEMMATFKIGEDRFMDSLLVSKSGNVCVCGDAVQKPFPLLVWDLNKRKLIYDLRMQGHEFLTKMAAISMDGQYIISVCREIADPDPNFLVVYALQSGSMFKKLKLEYSATSVAISTKSNLVVSGHEDGAVIVWDLIGGHQLFVLRGHCLGPDRIRLSLDGRRAVSCDSTGRDNSVRLWDLDTGTCLGCFYPGVAVTCCDIAPDGASVIVGLPGHKDIITLYPPGASAVKDESVFGDASRRGQAFDLS